MSSDRQSVQHDDGRAIKTDLRGAFAEEGGENQIKMSKFSVSEDTENRFVSKLSEELTPRDEKMYRYLVECIKYHQELLQ